ncbi:hypothetical protein [Mycolicibacterium sp.]|uniref:hypothetical protein n=1 Tax=Mycolicibacterium sp. TaxID=2320850 RepID=UPI0037C5D4F7
MMIVVVAAMVSIAVAVGLFVALHAWYSLTWQRYHGVVARDVLNRWEAQMAELSAADREQQRRYPPVEVMEATFALPSPWRFQVS